MIRFALAITLLGACTKHDAPVPGSGGAAGAAGAAAAQAHRAGGCDATLADFQALIAKPLTEVSGAPVGACNAYVSKGQPGFVTAALVYTGGAPHPFSPTDPGAHALAGVGDKAYWTAADSDRGPRLEAMKGAVQCEIEGPAAPTSTLKSTADADQAAYAQLMGKVCNDMFAAQ